MEKKPSVSLEKLLQAVALGNSEEEVLTTIAGCLARMEHRLSATDERQIIQASGGLTLKDLSHRLLDAVNPDLKIPLPLEGEGWGEGESPREAKTTRIQDAVKPFHNPKLRELLVTIKKNNEITIDHVSQDQIIEAGFSVEALERAKGIVHSFEQFIQDHKDEITAIQVLYSKPYKARLTFNHIKELAQAIERPPYLWNESQLWQAYAALEKSKVKGASAKRILTDLVSLVRFAMHQDNELVPFPEKVQVNFNAWMAQTIRHSREGGNPEPFTPQQIHWLEMIRDHIAANLSIDTEDFDYAPFAQEGGLGKVHQVFGDKLNKIIEELNETLAA